MKNKNLKRKSLLKRMLVICLIIVLFIGGIVFFFGRGPAFKFPETHQEVPVSEFERTFSPSELKEEMAFLFETMETVHPNVYFATPKSDVDQERKRIVDGIISPLTRSEFWLKLAPLVAGFSDGHTYMGIPDEPYNHYKKQGGLIFPLDVKLDVNADYAVILANYSSDSSVSTGDRVYAINGIPIPEMTEQLLRFPPGERIAFRKQLVEKRFDMLLWNVYGFKGEYEIEWGPSEGETHHVQKITGVTEETLQEKRNVPVKSGENSLIQTFRSLPDTKIGILKIDSFSAQTKDQIVPFLEESFTHIQKEGIRHLIIDIRQNSGGNYRYPATLLGYITDQPMSKKLYPSSKVKSSSQVKKYLQNSLAWYLPWFLVKSDSYFSPFESPFGEVVVVQEKLESTENPLRYNGRIYVLTGPSTYSSAAMFAVVVKDYQLGILVGEETGGLANFYASTYRFDLPRTHLPINVSCQYNYRPSGEDDGKGALPDNEIKPTLEDKIAGRDTVLEFTKELIQSTIDN